jgi:hypothetical protein
MDSNVSCGCRPPTAILLAVGALGFSAVAAADTLGSINFESAQSYVTGNINGQQGWLKTGPYDVEVEQTDRFGFGQALRISNAVTTGAFGDQAFSPGLTEPAGESARKHFEASFQIGTTSDARQQGLAISVSPDNGQGARMSYLRFVDEADGVHVFFDGTTATGDFMEKDIAILDRESAHSIRFLITFKRGADDVKVFVDGKKLISDTTWENYYDALGQQVAPVSKMLFRAGGTAAPDTADNGFLIDNLTLSSS